MAGWLTNWQAGWILLLNVVLLLILLLCIDMLNIFMVYKTIKVKYMK